jgi:hypothetical protein
MKIPVYLIAASADHKMVAQWADRLDRSGIIEFTLQWWRTASTWSGRDSRLSYDEQVEVRDECLVALARARIVWCLWSDHSSTGRAVELGAAHERRRVLDTHLVITGPCIAAGCRGESIFQTGDFMAPSHNFGHDEVVRVARFLKTQSEAP